MGLTVGELVNYIEENLKEELTPEGLGQRYHYSSRQLYDCLHQATGMPLMAYVRKRRLAGAAREIALGRKLYDVAMDYGVETQAGFYKAFVKQIGCSPREFYIHHKQHRLKQADGKLLKGRETMRNMEEITIRKVEQGDVKSLWKNIYSRNTPEEVRERVRKNIEEMDKGTCIALAAVLDADVVGTVLVRKSQHILSANRCELYDVVVHPAFQRRGLGRRLGLEGLRRGREMGCDYAVVTCRGNGSEKFYLSLGMEICGRIPGGIQEPWEGGKTFDELILYKRL